MNKTLLKITAVAAGIFLLSACGESRFPGYEETETGLFYKVHLKGDESKPIVDGDVIFVKQIQMNEKDSVVFDSRTMLPPEQKYIAIQVGKQMYKGDFFDALKMMHVGDSTSFAIRMDSMFKYVQGPKPSYIDSTGYMIYVIKIDSAYSKEKVAKIEKEQKEKRIEMMKIMQAEEDSLISDYITKNKITVKPTESGLYFVEKSKGSGAMVMQGDTVTVEYKGLFMDGQLFDASANHPDKFSFAAGTGAVIPGWDEALLKMKKGSKAHLVIPSKIAYGPYGYQSIPPFTPLVFDLEVVGIKSAVKPSK